MGSLKEPDEPQPKLPVEKRRGVSGNLLPWICRGRAAARLRNSFLEIVQVIARRLPRAT
jgi:hypothetical protein